MRCRRSVQKTDISPCCCLPHFLRLLSVHRDLLALSISLPYASIACLGWPGRPAASQQLFNKHKIQFMGPIQEFCIRFDYSIFA
jgi:hypothetical protein